MNQRKQKELIARTAKVGKSRVKLNPEKSDDIKEAITRADLRSVIGTSIIIKNKKGVSRARARVRKEQQKKGRRKGPGSKKGAKYSRISKKQLWMNRVRVQRRFLSELKEKEKIDSKQYRSLYRMITGGFFRSKNHLKLYISKMEK
ncbi:MAG: 50S ribosomal protein L19e [Nanoarchaeota archaeon]|nr:50S ribosomal protein L19e [Nanoarchaeota archaeon]